jgi:1-deoxy-D-xylulose 5-phosphate reductoisomerase
VAVEHFLLDRIPFGRIVEVVEEELAAYAGGHRELEELMELDCETRWRTERRLGKQGATCC